MKYSFDGVNESAEIREENALNLTLSENTLAYFIHDRLPKLAREQCSVVEFVIPSY